MDRASEYSTVCTGIKLLNCAKKKLIGKLIVIPVYFTIIILLTKLYSLLILFTIVQPLLYLKDQLDSFKEETVKKKKTFILSIIQKLLLAAENKRKPTKNNGKIQFCSIAMAKGGVMYLFCCKIFYLVWI